MARKFGKLTIDNSVFMHYDVVAVDRQSAEFVFGSIIASDALLKNITKAIKKKTNCYIEGRCHCTIQGAFDVEKERQSNGDFSHMVLKKKDVIDKGSDNEVYTFYMLHRDQEELKEVLYDKIYVNTSVPILKDWIDYIITSFNRQNLIKSLAVYSSYETNPFEVSKVTFSKAGLLDIVQSGLRTGLISIDNVETNSEIMSEVNGLDMYLNVFGDVLAEKIQKAFTPKFNPHEDEYDEYVNNYDDSCHYGGIEIYEAQKAVIQSAVKNMDKNKTTLVIGEMGVGKTLLGSGMTYSHYRRKSGSSTIIMCPGHLVIKWKREVEKLVPNAKGYIVENISELMALEEKLKDKNKKEHTYVILSKENAKFSYEKRPAANWSTSKKTFVCPECGNPLFKEVFIGEGRQKTKIRVPLEKRDFAKEYAYNLTCGNKTRVYNTEKSKWENVSCGAKLWTPLNKFEQDCKWIKLGKEGWIYRAHFNELHDSYFERRNELNKKEQAFLLRLIEKKQELEETGNMTSSTKGVRKYSIAKYVRERLRGHIDYFVADELKS